MFLLEGGRRELGSDWATELSHPFLTDLQRLSWRTTAGNTNAYFYFRRPDADPAALRIERSYSDIGGVVRIGPPSGRLALLGGSISFEEERPGTQPVLVTDTALLPDTSTALINRYSSHHTARLNALWGLRNLRFVRVSGFDALEGTQDLRTGMQLAMLVGKGARFLGGKERDMFGSADIYYGMATPISFSAISLAGTGRRDDEGKWDGILAHGRAAFYLKPFNRQTWISGSHVERRLEAEGSIPAHVRGSGRGAARVQDGRCRRRTEVGRPRRGPLPDWPIQAARERGGGRIRRGRKDLGGRFAIRGEHPGLHLDRLQRSSGVAAAIAADDPRRFCVPREGRKETLAGSSDDGRRLHEDVPGRAARHPQQPRAVSARVGVQLAVG